MTLQVVQRHSVKGLVSIRYASRESHKYIRWETHLICALDCRIKKAFDLYLSSVSLKYNMHGVNAVQM